MAKIVNEEKIQQFKQYLLDSGKKVETVAKYNVEENAAEADIQELVDEGCDVIITASYGYGTEAKKFAAEYPDIEFCQATCSNANEEPVYKNYHNFMGTIYQGRYITGVVAGMKIKEMIDDGIITEEEFAKKKKELLGL